MKIQLSVGEKHYKEIKEKLVKADFEIDDDGPFLLSEKDRFISSIICKNVDGEKIQIDTDDIVFIESFGHNVVIHTKDSESYSAMDRLYQLGNALDSSKFIRVSNSSIIAKSHVKKIKPSLSMKFVLTMSDGSLVDVTRSYYSEFKSFFGI